MAPQNFNTKSGRDKKHKSTMKQSTTKAFEKKRVEERGGTSMGAQIIPIKVEKSSTPLQNFIQTPCFCPNRCFSRTSLMSHCTRNKLAYISSSYSQQIMPPHVQMIDSKRTDETPNFHDLRCGLSSQHYFHLSSLSENK